MFIEVRCATTKKKKKKKKKRKGDKITQRGSFGKSLSILWWRVHVSSIREEQEKAVCKVYTHTEKDKDRERERAFELGYLIEGSVCVPLASLQTAHPRQQWTLITTCITLYITRGRVYECEIPMRYLAAIESFHTIAIIFDWMERIAFPVKKASLFAIFIHSTGLEDAHRVNKICNGLLRYYSSKSRSEGALLRCFAIGIATVLISS